MKWLIVLFLVLGFNAKSQKNDISNKDICKQSAIDINYCFSEYPIKYIMSINLKTSETKFIESVIIRDPSDYRATILLVRFGPNSGIAIGYYKKSNGSGEIASYTNSDGVIMEYDYKTGVLKDETIDNEKVKVLKGSKMSVVVKNNHKVLEFTCNELNATFMLPDKY